MISSLKLVLKILKVWYTVNADVYGLLTLMCQIIIRKHYFKAITVSFAWPDYKPQPSSVHPQGCFKAACLPKIGEFHCFVRISKMFKLDNNTHEFYV